MKQDNNLSSGQIEMKGYPSDGRMSFTATGKSLTIDWGDGTIEEVMPNAIERIFNHEYLNNNLRIITITTDGMTSFGCSSANGIYHELRFGDCPDLKEVYCDGNSLTVLDISRSRALELLDCSYNQLTSLNVNGCSALTNLSCSNNKLTSLNVSSCSVLEWLNCGDNQLTSLSVSDCTALATLDCYLNRLTSEALNSIFETLSETRGSINVRGNPSASACNRNIATSKGWSIY